MSAAIPHSSGVDSVAKFGNSVVDEQIEIWSLLLQYTCTQVKIEKV
jgi:uncharacterized membrane protein